MWPNPADLVTFTDKILKGKLYFLCNVGELCSILVDKVRLKNTSSRNSQIFYMPKYVHPKCIPQNDHKYSK